MKKLIACAFVFTFLGCLDTTSAMEDPQNYGSCESLREGVLSELQGIYSMECEMCDILKSEANVLDEINDENLNTLKGDFEEILSRHRSFCEELKKDYAPRIVYEKTDQLENMLDTLERKLLSNHKIIKEIDSEFTEDELAILREFSNMFGWVSCFRHLQCNLEVFSVFSDRLRVQKEGIFNSDNYFEKAKGRLRGTAKSPQELKQQMLEIARNGAHSNFSQIKAHAIRLRRLMRMAGKYPELCERFGN